MKASGLRALAVSALVCTSLFGCRRVTQESLQLSNGLRAHLVASKGGDSAAIVVLYGVGADHDPAGRSGMAHLVSLLLAEPGAASSSPPSAQRSGGPTWHATVGDDYTAVSISVPPGELPRALDEAAARMASLSVEQAAFARARKRALEELQKMRGGDPVLGAMNYAAEAVRPSRGNGWRGGVAQEIEAIRAEDAAEFAKAFYKAANAQLVVVGPFEMDTIRAHVTSAFGQVPAGTPPMLRPPPDSHVSGTLVMGSAPAAIAWAVPAPSPGDADYAAYLVLAARLVRAAPSRAWQARFDPLGRPEALFVTGPIQSQERPDDAAARMRKEAGALLSAPPSSSDGELTEDTFGAGLGMRAVSVRDCASAPEQAAFALARREQLHVDGKSLAAAVKAMTQAKLAAAAKGFAAPRTAAAAVGGELSVR